MSTCNSAPFRFLDLPAELRCMVYDFLKPTIEYHGYYERAKSKDDGAQYSILERQALPVTLLATCRQIKTEAQPIFDKKFELMKLQPMRYHMEVRTATSIRIFARRRECWGPSYLGLVVNDIYADLARQSSRPSARLPIANDADLPFSEVLKMAEPTLTGTYSNDEGFRNLVAEMLLWVREVPYTADRKDAVELHIDGRIEDFTPNELSLLCYGTRWIWAGAGLAGALVIKSTNDPMQGVTETDLVWRDRTLWALQWTDTQREDMLKRGKGSMRYISVPDETR
jgi:hypothetical protein